MAEGNMTNTTNQTDYNELDEITNSINLYVTPILYIVGFPGNIFSLVIWLQKRMRHSSGCYLAALALDDLIFLALHILFELFTAWDVKVLNYPVICEAFPIFFLASQFLSPFLVLAFTTERYISICHPFQREKYCTVRRAKIVIICMVAAMPCLNAVHGYFWKFDEKSVCGTRPEVVEGGRSLYLVYTTTVEVLAFLIVPLSVLVLNMLVIREMRRLSRMDTVHLHGQAQKTGSTTVMLLAVSFYQIITTLPITIAFALYLTYSCDSIPCVTEEDKRAGAIYKLILTIINEYGITHYAFNIFIYICTGKMFRQELKKLICYPINKLIARLPMDYTSLRTKARGSEQSRNWVSTNGNHDNERTTEETLL